MDEVVWPHGSIEARRDGLPVRLRDPGGRAVWRCDWDGRELQRARFLTPTGDEIEVAPGPEHPIFGPAMQVERAGSAIARFSRVPLAVPDHLPAMDDPAALPPGAGTAILSFVAARARDERATRLRYRGPYATAALFDALLDCFRPAGDPADALARFTAGAETRAAEARMDEVPVDFEPAPFERRHHLDAGVCAQLRDGVEKLFVGGRAYARGGAGARRLERRGDGYAAVVAIGGATHCEVAQVDAAGALTSGPHPLPPITSPLSGRALPPEVSRALADALPARAPVLLRSALRDVLTDTPLRWGDPGPEEAAATAGAFVVHPALADRLEGRALLEAIARAVELPAQRLAQRRLKEGLSFSG